MDHGDVNRHRCGVRLDLAGGGYRVFAGVRNSADGDRLRSQAAGELVPVVVDVTDAVAIRAAAAQVEAAVGEAGLAGVVCNAGIIVPGPLELLPTSAFRRQLEVNVLGTHAVAVAALPLLRLARGRIVIVGSISGLVAPPFFGAYAASKTALEAMADVPADGVVPVADRGLHYRTRLRRHAPVGETRHGRRPA